MDMGGMSMTMFFNFNLPVTVLFFEWEIKDQGALIGSCFGIAVLGILYEIMKFLRQLWANKMREANEPFVLSASDCCDDDGIESYSISHKSSKFWIFHIVQSILHMVQVFIAYVLMLIVMTYNVWLVISLVAGAGAGYLISGILQVTMCAPKRRPMSSSPPKYNGSMRNANGNGGYNPYANGETSNGKHNGSYPNAVFSSD
uniref:probable low affinity copper uptake protein 2 n=1 Tax=Ciona intestinalis TaxID=7719 RepID=UPI000EF5169F|nr:probable low affinity copper uptake protein 2 [Ciona intestinalis]|eukprot:XP_004226335.3 probable low affinity copper uptake protein 2 [Ciona intestinalis]